MRNRKYENAHKEIARQDLTSSPPLCYDGSQGPPSHGKGRIMWTSGNRRLFLPKGG